MTVGTIEARKPRRIVLLNDTTAWYHWGCTCTSLAIREQITRRGFALGSVPIDAVYGLGEPPNTIADFDDPAFLARFSKANRRVMETLRAADAVIVNGEGTLHGIKPVVRNLLYLAYAAKVHLGRPVQIINHSCFPENSAQITHPPTGALYRRVYEAMDHVAVREPISGQILQALGVPAVQSFDSLPLYVAHHYRAEEGRKRGGVVLAGGVSWRRETMPILARFIERVRDAGLTVSVLIGAKASPAPDDAAFVAALREAAPRGWALIEAGSARAWLDVIARAGLLVSARFHHSIAALCLRTPFVALSSNTPKMEGMLAMTGQPEPLASADPDLLDRLVERFEVALADGLPVLDEAALARVRALAQHNFAGLDALASATEAAR